FWPPFLKRDLAPPAETWVIAHHCETVGVRLLRLVYTPRAHSVTSQYPRFPRIREKGHKVSLRIKRTSNKQRRPDRSHTLHEDLLAETNGARPLYSDMPHFRISSLLKLQPITCLMLEPF